MLVAVVLGAVLAVPLTGVMRGVAYRHGLVDKPRSDRIHTKATPYLGGVSVCCASIVVAALGWTLTSSWGINTVTLYVACLAMAALGLLDDIGGLSPRLRLGAEAVAATAVVAVGGVITFTTVPLLDALLTVAVIVILTNSYNLLDNSDAALSSVAAVTGLGVTVLSLWTGVLAVGWLSAAVAGACLGFLVFNWPPARIFLGDAGSLFIGFALMSSLAFTQSHTDPAVAIAVCAGILLVPMTDTSLVIITRLRERRPILEGGKDHLHHRLARTGLGTAGAAVSTALVACFGVALALATASSWAPPWATLIVAAVLVTASLLWGLSKPCTSHDARRTSRASR